MDEERRLARLAKIDERRERNDLIERTTTPGERALIKSAFTGAQLTPEERDAAEQELRRLNHFFGGRQRSERQR